jgi:hypothetical protein
VVNELYSENLNVVNRLNYHVIAKYVHKVYCHGGAGTMFAFYLNGVDVEIRPQAYDQEFNARWLDKQPQLMVPIDYEKEYNMFRKNVAKIFGKEVEEKPLQTSKFETFLLKDGRNLQDMNEKLFFYTAKVTKVSESITRVDCVLVAASMLYGQDSINYKKFKEAYDYYTQQRVIVTMEDILFIVITANVPSAIYAEYDGSLVKYKKGNFGNKCIYVNDRCDHASLGEVTEITDQDYEETGTLIEMWPDKDIETLNSVTKDIVLVLNDPNYKSKVISERDTKTLQACRRLTWRDRWSVIMRQSTTCLILQTTTNVGCSFTMDARVKAWKCYLAFSNKGVVKVVAINVSGMRKIAL